MAMVLRGAGLGWIEEIVPSAVSVLVVIDPLRVTRGEAQRSIASLVERQEMRADGVSIPHREVLIPVCYEAQMGPDLGMIARRMGATVEEAISMHTGGNYTVEAIGFSPGFGYLTGLDPRLHAPRLATPRTRVPAGSVAIGGDRTGVYPQSTPGGWRIIGRTPRRLFDVGRQPPAVLEVGDRVRFVRISADGFERDARGAGDEEADPSMGGRP